MTHMKISMVGLLLIAGMAKAWALDDYRCTIEQVISASSEKPLGRMFIGREFTVDRASGRMAGTLKNAFITEPKVIDYGSTENSYKVVTTMRMEEGAGAGSSIFALTIEEFVEGERKGFVFLADGEVYQGWCKHF